MRINYLITFDSKHENGGSVSGYFELVSNEDCSYGCIPYLPIPASWVKKNTHNINNEKFR